MKRETIEQVLVLLQELKDGKITEEHKKTGICSFLDLEMNRRHKVILDHGWNYSFNCAWEHFSGALVYPVPDPEGLTTPSRAYHDCAYYWVGPYGELRINLVNHYIKCLEEMV